MRLKTTAASSVVPHFLQRDKVTIMVGGAPVNQAFADSINADIYTEDAASAADAAAAIFEG